MRVLCFIAVGFLLSGASARARQTYTLGDVRFSSLPAEEGETSQGYLDYRCMLYNDSAEGRTVTVQLTQSYGGATSVERTVTVAPKTTARVSLPCHPVRYGSYEYHIRVRETGKIKTTSPPHISHQISHNKNETYRFLVLAPLGGNEFMAKIKPTTTTTTTRSGRVRSSSSLSPEWENSSANEWKEGVDQLSEMWQGLIRFNAIAVTGPDLAAASPRHRQTLKDYILAGGVLLVFDAPATPLEFTPLKVGESGGITFAEHGFGTLALLKEKRANDLTEERGKEIARVVELHGRRRTNPAPLSVHREMPVVPDITVPLRSTFLLMLAFSILAGPVLVIVLARKNRRIMLNWAIPALSIATSALLVVYAFASEGITPHVRLSGMTFLNQLDKTAVTLGTQGYYSPFIPTRGLVFSTATEIGKFQDYYGYRSNPNLNHSVDWTSCQNLSRGWIQARVPEYFACRTVERRRERIDFTRNPDGALTLVNGLGADIRSLAVRDLEGNTYKAENIRAGEERKITVSSDKPSGTHSLTDFLNEELWLVVDYGKAVRRKTELRPGTYVAEMDAAPFMENGLSYKKCKIQAESVVHGLWESRDGR